MKSVLRQLLITTLCCTAPAGWLRAVEPGFISLLDRDHTDGWKQCGNTEMRLQDGVATTWSPAKDARGLYWYTARPFRDFVIRLEYSLDGPSSNSGVFVRFPALGSDPRLASEKGYEIQIYGFAERRHPTGEIWGFQPPTCVPQRATGWNEIEVAVVGQRYTVILNGQTINQFTGNRSEEGYIGLQNYPGAAVHLRNVRIKDLSMTTPALISLQEKVPGDSKQPLLETLSQQAVNASAWVLAPLDSGVPPDIRQNVTYLREDLLDEAVKQPKATPEAYKIAGQLCDTMIAALDERDRALARAGFRAMEANARTGVTSQALEARRNYKMSWPQFARENAQRAELTSQAVNSAAVMAERPKLEWSNRTDQIRPTLDALYKQFREALRHSPVAK